MKKLNNALRMGIWLDDDLIAILRNEANKNGVSTSEEVRQRLWRSISVSPETMREAKRYEAAWLDIE
jgi:plasmid stability protein